MTWPFGHLQAGAYSVITADPPWSYVVYSDRGKRRSAERHYETMGLEDIKSLPVADLATKDAHLFLWITGPHLVQGCHVEIMRAWGFEPSSMAFVWLKPKKALYEQAELFFTLSESLFVKGMGHTTRQNAEFVVLGRRGSPKRFTKAMHQIIVAPRREHSRKPEEFYDRVQVYAGDARRCELFSRQRRPGWDVWGDEATKFNEAVA